MVGCSNAFFGVALASVALSVAAAKVRRPRAADMVPIWREQWAVWSLLSYLTR